MIHLFTNPSSESSITWSLTCIPPSPRQTRLSLFECEINSDVSGCVIVQVCCLTLTPTVPADKVCYLSRRRSWLLDDIWNGAEASRCGSWINTGKAPCPHLTFAWAGRVTRPNTMLLRRYYIPPVTGSCGSQHQGFLAAFFLPLREILYLNVWGVCAWMCVSSHRCVWSGQQTLLLTHWTIPSTSWTTT